MSNKFPKSEKLKSLSSIEQLFLKSENVFSYPLKTVYQIEKESLLPGIKIAVSVPKRNVKKAHDRNRIKRQIREAYRLNNKELKQVIADSKLNMDVMFIYVDKQEIEYSKIEAAIKICIQKLLNKIKI